MATFVLVHGAFGTPTELAPVIPWLEALGHRAIAIDLPCANPVATLDDYALAVVGAMAPIQGPVVVVGHSAGSATISLLPGRTRVDRLRARRGVGRAGPIHVSSQDSEAQALQGER